MRKPQLSYIFKPHNLSTTSIKASLGLAITLVVCSTLSAQTASNGLTKVGTDFRLGGTLTQNTTIDLGTSYFFKLSKSTQNYLTVINNGNVGIGLATPSAQLHTTGSVQFNALAGTGSRMIVADANGLLSTQAIPSGSGATITSLRLAFGSATNTLTDNANLTFDATNKILRVGQDGNTGTSYLVMGGNSQIRFWDINAPAYIYESYGLHLRGAGIQPTQIESSSLVVGATAGGGNYGSGRIYATGSLMLGSGWSPDVDYGSGRIYASSLASGTTSPAITGTTKMVIADANGLLSTQAIATGGGSITINNNAANRIITGSNSANNLDAQTSLTFSNGHLSVTQSADSSALSVYAMNLINNNAFNIYVPTQAKAIVIRASGESWGRSTFYGDGSYGIGPGNAARDIFLDRPSASKLRISSDRGTGAASIQITGLATSGLAPSSSGITKMVTTDQDGLLSFADMPSGGTGSALLANTQTFTGTNTFTSNMVLHDATAGANKIRFTTGGTNTAAHEISWAFNYGNGPKAKLMGYNTSGYGKGYLSFQINGTDDNVEASLSDEVMQIHHNRVQVTKELISASNNLSILNPTTGNTADKALRFVHNNYSASEAQVAIVSRHEGQTNRGDLRFVLSPSTINGGGYDSDTDAKMIISDNGHIKITSLKTGSTAPVPTGTTKMVVADAFGLLSTQAIPTGGGSVSLPSTQIAYGSTGNAVTGNSNLTFDGTKLLVNGNVGIGTINTNDVSYKLFVETGIRTRKVKVDQATWADYVFEPSYKLPSLEEVESFIKQHKHLPDVPSARDVQKEGLNLGDNQALLLKKIEELTLYAIDQNKKLEIEILRNKALEGRLKKLEKAIMK